MQLEDRDMPSILGGAEIFGLGWRLDAEPPSTNGNILQSLRQLYFPAQLELNLILCYLKASSDGST